MKLSPLCLLALLLGITGNNSVGAVACGDIVISDATTAVPDDGQGNVCTVADSVTVKATTTLVNIDMLSSLTTINGGLEIRDNTALTSVSGLDSLTFLGGDLEIDDCPAIISLDGFSALEQVGKNFFLNNCPALETVTAFSQLKSVAMLFVISELPQLVTLQGFRAVQKVGGFQVVNNAKLPSFEAFTSLTAIDDGELFVQGMPLIKNFEGLNSLASVVGTVEAGFTMFGMTSLDGLEALTSVGNDLKFTQLLLENIDGVSNVRTVGRNTWFENLSALTSITGLSSLQNTGSLILRRNRQLVSLDGLESLTKITQNLEIEINELITNVDPLAALTQVDGHLSISENADLVNIDGLSNVASVGRYLGITSNARLESIGLASLESVGLLDTPGYVDVNFNVVLSDIQGLKRLTTVRENLQVNGDEIADICHLINVNSVGGTLTVKGVNYATLGAYYSECLPQILSAREAQFTEQVASLKATYDADLAAVKTDFDSNADVGTTIVFIGSIVAVCLLLSNMWVMRKVDKHIRDEHRMSVLSKGPPSNITDKV